MTWEQICDDPDLAKLPHRVESDRWGCAVVRPLMTANHSGRMSRILRELQEREGDGHALVVCPLQTPEGVKTLDVGWISKERRRKQRRQWAALRVTPEICVEVREEFEPVEQMHERFGIYFGIGALECWLCEPDGRLHFFNGAGSLARSAIRADFPQSVNDED